MPYASFWLFWDCAVALRIAVTTRKVRAARSELSVAQALLPVSDRGTRRSESAQENRPRRTAFDHSQEWLCYRWINENRRRRPCNPDVPATEKPVPLHRQLMPQSDG